MSLPLLTMAGAAAAQPSSPSTSPSPSLSAAPPIRATLNKYCVTCHNDRLKTAGFTLEHLNPADIPADAEAWEKVVGKLRTGAMPPARLPRPDADTSQAIAAWVEGTLDRAAAAAPNPGRRAIHRLNRAEYANVIRDLLAIEIDARALLPADEQGFGFDNNADVLTVSPGLMDRYLAAARKVSRAAIGDPDTRHVVETYNVSRLLTQDDRASEDLPLGSRGGLSVRHYFPLDAEYVLRVRLQGNAARNTGDQVEVRLDGERIHLFTVGDAAPDDKSGGLEVRFAAKAGPRMLSVTLPKRVSAVEGVGPARLPVTSISFRAGGIAGVDLDGPYNPRGPGDTPSRRRIFTCRPAAAKDEMACAAQILTSLAQRAYRRPATAADVDTLMTFYRSGRDQGFEFGIRAALERVLVDPEFLFRVEREPAGLAPGTPYRISDLELASRLSFFLWSSAPDDALRDAAATGALRDPRVLESQVRRMLADPRAATLVTNFASQWLHLRNMRAVAPDALLFPDFDDNLRDAFQRETELFIESQLREDRSVPELLTADYSFLNERLARHYGIPNVYGSHFRRVAFEGGTRGGLLGQGSILTVTSYATRTSPVVRGKWLLENVLGAPPPPPPANVPPLGDNAKGVKTLSVRERMIEHRKNPVCSSCHSRMDPLGFALENFDAIGKWRDKAEDATPIDASGALPDGTKFDGPAELKRILITRQDEFVTTVAERLLTYALGRGFEYFDRPALRAIVRDAAASDYRWSSLVLGIVRSAPFQMRNTKP
jgi:hypothetical protein